MTATSLTQEQMEILSLRDEVMDLREEVERLNTMLAGDPQGVPTALGLCRAEAALIASLMAAPDGYRSTEALHRVVAVHEDTSEQTVRTHVYRIRRKLTRHAVKITTVWGSGYRIDPSSRRRIEKISQQSEVANDRS